jgi:hypothetical protein
MLTSTTVTEITKALLAFNKEIGIIKKDATNPFFKSKYADLPGILSAISGPLVKNSLVIVQFPEGEHGLTTRLLHTSGEWMESTYYMHPVKTTPQDAGSAITYQRRYAIGAVLNLNIDEDDDGAKASGNGQESNPANAEKPWLNENTKEYKGAVAKLTAGQTTIQKIEEHFKLSQKVKAQLAEHAAQAF